MSVCAITMGTQSEVAVPVLEESWAPPPAQSAGCKVSGKAWEHTHAVPARCVEEVIVSVAGRLPGRAGEKMRSSLWSSLFARGGPAQYLCSLFIRFPSAPLHRSVLSFIVPLFASFARRPRPTSLCLCSLSILPHLSLPSVQLFPLSSSSPSSPGPTEHSLRGCSAPTESNNHTCVYPFCPLTVSR